MELYIKYNIDMMCKVLLQQQLDKLKISCRVTEPGYVKFKENIPMETYNKLIDSLREFGIEIVDNQKKHTGTKNQECHYRDAVFR